MGDLEGKREPRENLVIENILPMPDLDNLTAPQAADAFLKSEVCQRFAGGMRTQSGVLVGVLCGARAACGGGDVRTAPAESHQSRKAGMDKLMLRALGDELLDDPWEF